VKKEIDRGIKDIIKFLNNNNFNTEYSCSGLYKDHLTDEDAFCYKKGNKGYISFVPLSNDKELLIKKAALSSCFAFSGSNEEIISLNVENNKINRKKEISKHCAVYTYFPIIKNLTKEKITTEIMDQILEHNWNNFKKIIENEIFQGIIEKKVE